MMFPNFEKFFPDVQIPAEGSMAEPVNETRSSCIRIGAFSVVRRIIEDYKLAEHLKRWDDREKGLLLDLAAIWPRIQLLQKATWLSTSRIMPTTIH